MFAEVRDMLPISGDGYDAEIILQIKAAALDLTTSAEIVLPGEIHITRELDPATNKWKVTDASTLKDELVITAIAAWCQMMIGNPPNFENLKTVYNGLKKRMRMSRHYTRYAGQDGPEEATTE